MFHSNKTKAMVMSRTQGGGEEDWILLGDKRYKW